jgi:hypothetical protein
MVFCGAKAPLDCGSWWPGAAWAVGITLICTPTSAGPLSCRDRADHLAPPVVTTNEEDKTWCLCGNLSIETWLDYRYGGLYVYIRSKMSSLNIPSRWRRVKRSCDNSSTSKFSRIQIQRTKRNVARCHRVETFVSRIVTKTDWEFGSDCH